MPVAESNGDASGRGADFSKTKARRTPGNAQRAWRCAAGGVQLLLGRRLHSRVVLEELLVQVDEVLPLLGGFVLGEDRFHRAYGLAGPAVDALVRMDVEHRLAFV